MAEIEAPTYPHNILEDCRHLISDESLALLAEHEVAIDIKQARNCWRIYNFPFAGVFEYFPIQFDNGGKSNGITYNRIRDVELNKSVHDTAKIVLARLGHDVAHTHYWPVYLYELDTPDEQGRTKIYTTNINDFPEGAGNFAGFGYKDKRFNNPDLQEEWLVEQEAALMKALHTVEIWINNMAVEITFRDANDGMFIECGGECAKFENPLNFRIRTRVAEAAARYRARSDYKKLKADRKATTHVIPEEYQHLVSDETKALLDEHSILIKVSELPRQCGVWCPFIFAGVQEFYPRNEWAWSKESPYFYSDIQDSEFGDSVDETAMAVMARLGGDLSTMSYWPVYLYESDQPSELGHTLLYTIDVRDLPADGGNLAGIAFRYKHDLTPEHRDGSNPRPHLTSLQEKMAVMSADEKKVLDDEWEEDAMMSLERSLIDVELWLNAKFLTVSYHNIVNGDLINTCEFYEKSATPFNAKIVESMAEITDVPRDHWTTYHPA